MQADYCLPETLAMADSYAEDKAVCVISPGGCCFCFVTLEAVQDILSPQTNASGP